MLSHHAFCKEKCAKEWAKTYLLKSEEEPIEKKPRPLEYDCVEFDFINGTISYKNLEKKLNFPVEYDQKLHGLSKEKYGTIFNSAV